MLPKDRGEAAGVSPRAMLEGPRAEPGAAVPASALGDTPRPGTDETPSPSDLHSVRERWAEDLDSLLDEIGVCARAITRTVLPTDPVHLEKVLVSLGAEGKHLERLCKQAERLAWLLDDTSEETTGARRPSVVESAASPRQEPS